MIALSTRRFLSTFVALAALLTTGTFAQELRLETGDGLQALAFAPQQGPALAFAQPLPLFSMLVDDVPVDAGAAQLLAAPDDTLRFRFDNGLTGKLTTDAAFAPGWKAVVTLTNTTGDTVKVENVVPFGAREDHVYITASGPWSLARTKLYRPGESPVGVVLPDNAWEMGYGAVPAGEAGQSVAAIARRTAFEEADRTRWHTALHPGGSVTYTFYADAYDGPWQNGLRLMFRDRYLYDLEAFDDTLFEREDLQWIRDAYVIGLQMAWDHEFYDPRNGGYRLMDFLEEGERLFGGYDVYSIWPTWPRLGVDPRNQWDMYRDLPGGLDTLRALAEQMRTRGTRFFIAFNPWDQSTRAEDPYRGMARLIDATGADGVVLDTRGSSSFELQAAADSVRPGVVMYSEGMAVPKDMPGIVSGRVHDAILMPPPLNLNKLIKPEFSIFRVGQVYDGHLHREAAVAFFNGYGTEINLFRPGRHPWLEDALAYLGRTTMILRQHSDAFHARAWTPLVPSLRDSVWVNAWPDGDKTVYTLYSLVPAGYEGPLIPIEPSPDHHYVDLWHHEEIVPDTVDGRLYLPARLDAFNASWLGTRQEGQVAAVAALPRLLDVRHDIDSLFVSAPAGTEIALWAGLPSYQNTPVTLPAGRHAVSLREHFGTYDGRFVVQLFDGRELLDERVVHVEPGTPRLISRVVPTAPASEAPEGMVYVPGGALAMELKSNGHTGTGIMRYPQRYERGDTFRVAPFYVDRYPVTNADFETFLDATGYAPDDTTNFLKHWAGGRVPEGLERHPVVYVSLDDARAYAAWAGNRLPTELEWQLAAQGTDGRTWPWGHEFDSTRANVDLGHTTPVDAYPGGASPYGVMDLVGNVWQLTNDVYDNNMAYFVMMRGGSFYHPTSSWWYVKNGPRPLDEHQILLLVSPSFDRNATVGFRTVRDAAAAR